MQVPYAKGNDRFLAYAIDAGACAMFLFALVVLFEDACNSRAAGSALFACIFFLYQLAFLTYREGITLGKDTRHIQPVSSQGQPLTPGQKVIRAFFTALPYFFIGADRSLAWGAELLPPNALAVAPMIGILLLMADVYPLEFHKQPRTLTDRIARTIVVALPPPQPHRAPAFPMYSRHDAEFGVPPPDRDQSKP
ncbi:MAG: hypothetical protein RI907_3481 [Pseudomonadota bacterium]|jgi:uncharacterized RDD family membrane protein YckC